MPLLSALCGCAAQVDEDYQGEPIAKLQGVVVVGSSAESIPEVNAAIVWTTRGENGTRYIGERIPVDGSFPASFSLSLFGPPPPQAEARAAQDYCLDGKETATPAEDCDAGFIPKGTGVGEWSGFLTAIDARVPDGESA